MGDKELTSWSQYHGARIPRDRAGATPAENVGLPGPPMTPAERRIDGHTDPQTDNGLRICWNYNSHLGCTYTARPRASEYYENYDSLTPAFKIALVKRSGFKKEKRRWQDSRCDNGNT